jgi:Putative  PD-(D/E)XK family member, (DUF4420)
MTTSPTTMTSVEALWANLTRAGQVGGAQRVDELHPCDLYAALDPAGSRGLVLVTDTQPPAAPVLEAVEVSVSQRHDGRWSLGIWLRVQALEPPFARLCQDLIEASREVDPAEAGTFMLTRLARWRRLLEAGASPLSIMELRGLIGELVVLKHCLDLWQPDEVVGGWVGPHEAPQDFALPSVLIEAKTVYPTASVVKISSVDQLDAAGRLILAVVTLTTLTTDTGGVSLAEIVAEIEGVLIARGSYSATLELASSLAAAGCSEPPLFDRPRFRIDALRFYEVGPGFPLLRRSDLPAGVADAIYEIELGACSTFQTSLEG